MSHLISLSTKVDKLHHFITLSKEYQEDLRMWSTFLSGWNLLFFFYDDQITVAGDMELFTVAASNFGFGDYFKRKWFSSDWHLALASITYLSPLEGVSAGRRHPNGYELCPSSSRFIFILMSWSFLKACKR